MAVTIVKHCITSVMLSVIRLQSDVAHGCSLDCSSCVYIGCVMEWPYQRSHGSTFWLAGSNDVLWLRWSVQCYIDTSGIICLWRWSLRLSLQTVCVCECCFYGCMSVAMSRWVWLRNASHAASTALTDWLTDCVPRRASVAISRRRRTSALRDLVYTRCFMCRCVER